MATPAEKLVESLEQLHALQSDGQIAIQSEELSRVHRQRLVEAGYLTEVIRGWYIPTSPNEPPGESTPWYTSFWQFCAKYFDVRFGKDWSLSPEQSLLLLTGNTSVPRQLIVRAENARNNKTDFPHDTAIIEIRSSRPDKNNTVVVDGLRLFSLPLALVNCTEGVYLQYPTEARTALASLKDPSDILMPLLEGGHSVIAGRIVGGLRNIGKDKFADAIVAAMQAAKYVINETDPFEYKLPTIISSRETSPYVTRIKLMWQAMREAIIEVFPQSPGLPKDIDSYIKEVEEVYKQDAYNSLSIEGYRVSMELIERVRSGDWAPNGEDKKQRDAMAARGYYLTSLEVRKAIVEILKGANAGKVLQDVHSTWYLKMFEPSVETGLLRPADLAGYRTIPIYIQRSMHTPPNVEAVRDLMPAFFELLAKEENAAVRVVLGHFIFVYIHPYVDGNGRMGRFLMNAMMASGGYPWTVVPLERREEYMQVLEQASVHQNIKPFATFLASLVKM
jgi:fido (protein-threonine AMPylation protein)